MSTGLSDNGSMEATTLLMGFHCHQPVGNFESVLRHGCKVCYGPLLEELARHPGFRFSIHMSGHLLEWIGVHEKGIFDLLAGTARQGQAEIFTAGFYEPVLTVIPPDDALDQIGLLSDLAQEMSGQRPEGLWLTERIWDPSLVPLLCEAGIKYTIVDDNHLHSSGYGSGDLSGYFLTETRGRAMAIYPISQGLRYATPFKPVPQALEAVRQAGSGGGRTAIVFDDGEKFGMWPHTADWVYGKGWLRDFATAVCQSGDIITSTFREHFHGNAPLGRIHLAPGSYMEMEEWTLQPEDAKAFHELESELENSGRGAAARRFLKGGLWPDFFIKYSESNNMHKKMIRISRRSREENVPAARRSLFQGQCNDAYWHGIFGGLYLPVLRNGVKRALNEAERILDDISGVPSPFLADINVDGFLEAELRSPDGVAVLTARGGQLYELSDKQSLFDLLATLTRRLEHYHLAAENEGNGEDGGVTTIHESVRSMSEHARASLLYDRYPRYAFIDHFQPPATGVEEMRTSSAPQWGDFADGLYDLKLVHGAVEASRSGFVNLPGLAPVQVTVQKRFELAGRSLTVDYRVNSAGGVSAEVDLCCEINLHLPSQTGCEATLDGRPFSLEDPVDCGSGSLVEVVDPVLPAPVTLGASLPGAVCSYPVQTVSQSEGGIEVSYQGCCIGYSRRLDLSERQTMSFRITLRF